MHNNCQNGCDGNRSASIISYNALTGKHVLSTTTGTKKLSTKLSNGLSWPGMDVLEDGSAFIGDFAGTFEAIPKAKLFTEDPQDFVPCFIIAVDYDIAELDVDDLDTVVPCQSRFQSLAQYLPKGLVPPNVHFCARQCAIQQYFPLAGTFDITHIASEDYSVCRDWAKPGPIARLPINFYGADTYGKVLFSTPFTEDYPGLEPAVHTITIVGQGLATANYFSICPQGISAYANITMFASSRGQIYGGLPSTICVNLCQTLSSTFNSSLNNESWTGGLSTYADPLLISSSIFPEWTIGDWQPDLLPAKPFTYMLPIGSSDRCGFSDPISGRQYSFNGWADVVWPRSIIDQQIVDQAIPGSAYRAKLEANLASQAPNAERDLATVAVYTHIKKLAVPELIGGLFTIQREPYREALALYNSSYKPFRPIRDFLVVVPKAKALNEWAVFSLIRMKKKELEYEPTFSYDTLSLTTGELGQYVHASCKYGYWQPEQITTNDQLKTGYGDYYYGADFEGLTAYAQGVVRKPGDFGPPRVQGNYGWEPFALPGDAKPDDVTSAQNKYKHTHTVRLDGTAFEFRHNSASGEALASLLLAEPAVPLDLIRTTAKALDYGTPAVPEIGYASVTNIGQAIEAYLTFVAPGVNLTNLLGAEVLRIKPLLA